MTLLNKVKEHLVVANSTCDDENIVQRFSMTVLGSLEQKIKQGYLIQVNSNELSDIDKDSVNLDTLRKLKEDI